jgi:hypothetical protein
MNIKLPMDDKQEKIENDEKIEHHEINPDKQYVSLEESVYSINNRDQDLMNINKIESEKNSLPFQKNLDDRNENMENLENNTGSNMPNLQNQENLENLEIPSRWKNFKNFFSIFKYIIFTFIMVISSVSNFSYFNLPYTFFGSLIILLFLIGGNKKFVTKILKFIFYFLISYSSAQIIFKLSILLILYTRGPGGFLFENKNLLNDFGIKFLDEKFYFSYVNTFIGDSLIFVSYFIFQIYKFGNLDEKNKYQDKEKEKEREINNSQNINSQNYPQNNSEINFFLLKFENKQILMLFIQIILIVIFNSTFVNFLSFFYSLMFILSLILWSLGVVKIMMKTINILIAFIAFSHFSLYHFFNIFSFRNFYITTVDDREKIFRWCGIVKMTPQFYVSKKQF